MVPIPVVYLVYFADRMCTSSRVSFMPLFSKAGYQKKVSFLKQVVKSVGCSHQGCGHGRNCYRCQFGIHESDKQHRGITDSCGNSKNRTENKRVMKTISSVPSHLLNSFSIFICTAKLQPRGGGVLNIFVRRGCAVFQGIVFAYFL